MFKKKKKIEKKKKKHIHKGCWCIVEFGEEIGYGDLCKYVF